MRILVDELSAQTIVKVKELSEDSAKKNISISCNAILGEC